MFNLIYDPGFFRIQVRDGALYGSIIDILNFGAPIMLVAIGMTMVIATKGVDLSVGSVVAIAGAAACLTISKGTDQNSLGLVVTAVILSLLLAAVLGLWNGLLVAAVRMQPFVATLILMVSGRGIAQLMTNGQIITIQSPRYAVLGSGSLFGLPLSVYIVAFVFLFAVLLTRKTALGLFIESVGRNPTASRLSGIRSFTVVVLVYVFSAVCAGIAGLILSSNVSSADGNNAGLWYELDAILAVVIGGTLMNGGRFYLLGTLIGALIIQTLTTTIYTTGVPPETIQVVKAIVVFIVCLIQSEAFRKKLSQLLVNRRKPVHQEAAEK